MKQDEITAKVYNICRNYIDCPFKLYLFGSRAKKTNQEFSDFDFFVETDEVLSNSIFNNIIEDIEKISTLYRIDLVYWNTANEDFKKMIYLSPKKEVVF